MDDHALLKKCLSGDKQGWDIFIEQFSPLIYDSILRTFRRFAYQDSSEVFSDLYHDFFLCLLEKDYAILRAYEGRNGCHLRHYLRTVVVRKTIDFLRTRHRRFSGLYSYRIEPIKNGEILDALSAEIFRRRWDSFFSKEAAQLLLADLSEEERNLYRMFFSDNMKPREIASLLGISVPCFYVRKQRLLKKMKRMAEDRSLMY
ncbi:MAG TPA: sigma-70 family RNA polymerase sigma factor [Candidatus Omnitrophota bacterium]|nr:sigma-70 family RNA polymerase sigma factor [Candidatus Omnitrophota bacterium]HQO58726.1 sigma-70 family RNA polymerase sigma factor [Candidatus Omnitrophota bacterium]HQP11770.1 sigma-70 family RNA polymerase sigma factor [Candidatus Omnitrophota bacterium]